jgi:hypothetical protein
MPIAEKSQEEVNRCHSGPEVRGQSETNSKLSFAAIELDSCGGRCPNKSSIRRPKLAVRKQHGSKKVRIDPADAEPSKLPVFNQCHGQ